MRVAAIDVGTNSILLTIAEPRGPGQWHVVEDRCRVEGMGGTHQFVTVGRLAWSRTHIPNTEDVPPFMVIDGNHIEVRGVNPASRTEALEKAYVTVWRSGLPRSVSVALLEKDASAEVRVLAAFLRRSATGRNGRAEEGKRA